MYPSKGLWARDLGASSYQSLCWTRTLDSSWSLGAASEPSLVFQPCQDLRFSQHRILLNFDVQLSLAHLPLDG